jgi:hypothetical protein
MAGMQTQTNLVAQSGNRVIVTFGGVQVGLIQSLRMSDDYAPDPASGIGDIHVQEYVPTMARHSLSVSGMVLFNNSLRQVGVFPENGDAVLQGLVFDIESYSKDSGALLRKYIGCSYASGDTEISKHAILMNSGTLNALDTSGTAI